MSPIGTNKFVSIRRTDLSINATDILKLAGFSDNDAYGDVPFGKGDSQGKVLKDPITQEFIYRTKKGLNFATC
jgi:expansin (peptidoglycan-binding protein)